MESVNIPNMIVGSYKLLEKVGHGTYGQVFTAQHVCSGEKFAIKKIQYNVTEDYIFLHFREISLLKSLKHESIIEVSEVVLPSSIENDCIYIVFALFDSDLRMYIKKHFADKRVPCAIIKAILKQVSDGLHYCHSRKIMHRDIKPPNILVDWSTLRIKICDFGLAKSLVHRAFADENSIALTHEIVTLWYRAPEVLLGAPMYDYTIDVWSLGVVLMEMLWGVCPFDGRTEIETLMKIFKLVGTPDPENCPGCAEWEFWSDKFPIWDPEQSLFRMIKRDTAMHDVGLIELAERMLKINPRNRLKCVEVLQHKALSN